jgi:alkylhydroperoxidase family enzyme
VRRSPRLERLADAADALRRAVLESPGATTVEARRAASDGTADEPVAAAYVATVQQAAYRITDGRVLELRASGLSDDQVFELTVAAALGEAQRRLDAGLALVDTGGDA